MRRGSYILTLTCAGILGLMCAPVSAQHRSRDQVDVDVFYDGLAPYGEWVEMQDYGWSWAPRVERGWRPYTRGQWASTDDGWYWDSDEEFGWATYHYGRWVDDPYYGWIWVPGTEWAPAWVSWRHGNGYTGWAPLPPRATWQTRIGLSIGGLDLDAFIGANDYVFVQDRAFVDRGVYQHALPWERNRNIINMTDNVTSYTIVNNRVVNRGIAIATVERAVGRSVERVRAVDVDRASPPSRGRAGEVSVYRPEVRFTPGRRPTEGRSLVRGEEAPQYLVERRNQRAQDRQQNQREAEVTAKEAAQRAVGRPGDVRRNTGRQQQAPHSDATNQAQEAVRQRDQARQDAERKQSEAREQQRLDREKSEMTNQQRDRLEYESQGAKRDNDVQAEAARRAKDAQREAAREPAPVAAPERHPQTRQPDVDSQQRDAQRQRDLARQEADKKQSEAQQQQRVDRERNQANAQEQRDRQQAERQHGKPPSDGAAQAAKRAADAQQKAKDKAKDDAKKKDEPKP